MLYTGTENTAQLREMARLAESALSWGTASALYKLAADKYPANGGALAEADIKHLRHNAAACRTMYLRDNKLCEES